MRARPVRVEDRKKHVDNVIVMFGLEDIPVHVQLKRIAVDLAIGEVCYRFRHLFDRVLEADLLRALPVEQDEVPVGTAHAG